MKSGTPCPVYRAMCSIHLTSHDTTLEQTCCNVLAYAAIERGIAGKVTDCRGTAVEDNIKGGIIGTGGLM